MSHATLQTVAPAPLTSFTEDEVLFRENIRQFAEEKVRPLAKEMDEKGVFEKDLLHEFFQLGLMGIEIPEQFGGGGASFFEAGHCSRRDVASGCVRRRHRGRAKHAGKQCVIALDQRRTEETLSAAHGRRHLRSLCSQRSRFGL